MSLPDVATPFEWAINTGGRKPSDTHALLAVAIYRVEIAEQVVLAANGDGRPIAISVLLRFVDFVFSIRGHLPSFDLVLSNFFRSRFTRVVRRVVSVPVRVRVFAEFASGLCPFINRRCQNLEILDAVLTDRVQCQGRIPSVGRSVDRAPVFQNQMKLPFQIAKDSSVRTVAWIFKSHPHVFARLAIGEVTVDD